MKKFLGLLMALMLLTLGLVSAEIANTRVRSYDQTSATIDDKEVMFPLRDRLNMHYREHYYARRGLEVDSGSIGLVLQGATALTGGGGRGDRPLYSTLRLSGRVTSVEQVDGCTVEVEFAPRYATLSHGRGRTILRNPLVYATHDTCVGEVEITVEHPNLGYTSAIFSA